MASPKIVLMALSFFLLTGFQTSHSSSIPNKNSSSESTNKKVIRTVVTKTRHTYRVWGKPYHVLASSKHYQEKGVASWYGAAFHRRMTSSGERYNMYQMTAAHKTLPLATNVLVTNLANGKQVVLKVNDRGPFVSNRLIDVSYAAAKKLGMVGIGLAPVIVKAIG